MSSLLFLTSLSQGIAQQIADKQISSTNVEVGSSFTVTVKGNNNLGGVASQGGITIQVREAFTKNSELSIGSYTATNAAPFYEVWKGGSLSNGTRTAQFMHIEPNWTNWSNGVTKTFSLTLIARKAGTYNVYAKMYLLKGDQAFIAPTTGTTDHQGEKTVKVGTVTVQEPQPDPVLVNVSISPSTVQQGNPITVSIEAENDGAEAGDYSSITASVWTDATNHNVAISGMSASWADQKINKNPGEGAIQTKSGSSMTPVHEFVEFVEQNWPTGQRRSASFVITPDRSGTLRVRVRTTMADKSGNHYNDRSSSGEDRNTTDQQGWDVAEYDIIVSPPTRTVTLALDGTTGGAQPENVQWSIAGLSGVGNPAVVANVPLGTQTVWASHKTMNSANPWNEAERWIDHSVTVDSPLVFTRDLPYATSGIQIKDGNYETVVGSAVVPQVSVRNDSATSRNVVVQLRLSRTKNFNSPDISKTSSAVSVAGGQTKHIDLPAVTPSESGDYFAVYKVVTQGLTGGDKTTDTAHWGDVPTLKVSANEKTVTLALEGTVEGAQPENVQWSIAGLSGTGNPAVVANVPLGTQTVWASHKTTNSANPWDEAERWIDRSVTVDSPLVFTRDLPYATSGVQIKNGSYETAVGNAVVPQVSVRNDSATPRNVVVHLRLSRTKNFDSPDISKTSSAVSVASGQTKLIDLPAVTPLESGDYFSVYKVVTQGLTGGDKTTDTAHWGDVPTLKVSSNEKTVTLALEGTLEGAQPENVQWSIAGLSGTGNPAVVANVPLGTQTVWASHKTTNSANPWNEAEHWIDRSVTVDSPLVFTRDLPYATSGIQIKDGNYETVVGRAVVPQVSVRNDSATSRKVLVQSRLSRTKNFNSPDISKTSNAVSVAGGQTKLIDLPAVTPSESGDYFAVYKVVTQGLTGGDKTTDTAHWGDVPSLKVSGSQARVEKIVRSEASVERLLQDEVTVTIRNTGQSTRSYWVGLSLRNLSKVGGTEEWVAHYPPVESGTLVPNETATVVFDIELPHWLETGTYALTSAVWQGWDQVSNEMLEPKYDEVTEEIGNYTEPVPFPPIFVNDAG